MYLVMETTGFLGSTICKQLIERGERVKDFVLLGDKAAQFCMKIC